ncbi:DUF2624 domain-containing protein [Bacillus salitolerans]|uniref:DUF2624 domain-containing protein n=1 Tax=Bacillus salitolerans TaxID=1437434 RepID=A0ABW4LN31_9BACI
MNILQQVINGQLNRITKKDLMNYASQYNISITSAQAEKIVSLLKNKQVNIFDASERTKLLKSVAKITNPEVAKKVNQLFQQFIN